MRQETIVFSCHKWLNLRLYKGTRYDKSRDSDSKHELKKTSPIGEDNLPLSEDNLPNVNTKHTRIVLPFLPPSSPFYHERRHQITCEKKDKTNSINIQTNVRKWITQIK